MHFKFSSLSLLLGTYFTVICIKKLEEKFSKENVCHSRCPTVVKHKFMYTLFVCLFLIWQMSLSLKTLCLEAVDLFCYTYGINEE